MTIRAGNETGVMSYSQMLVIINDDDDGGRRES
jgi:hypothetical protein